MSRTLIIITYLIFEIGVGRGFLDTYLTAEPAPCPELSFEVPNWTKHFSPAAKIGALYAIYNITSLPDFMRAFPLNGFL